MELSLLKAGAQKKSSQLNSNILQKKKNNKTNISMAAQLNNFISYRYKWVSLECFRLSAKVTKLRPKNLTSNTAGSIQLPGASSSACSEQFSQFSQLSPAEGCSPWNGLCPSLNQTTGEQMATCKTNSILIYFRYVNFSLPYQSTGTELLNLLTDILRVSKNGYTEAQNAWRDLGWTRMESSAWRWGLPSSKGSFQSKICLLCPLGTKPPHTLTPTTTSSGHKEITAKKISNKWVCRGLLINLGTLQLCWVFWEELGSFLGSKLHNFFPFRQSVPNSAANSPVLMREDIHTFLKLTSLLFLYLLKYSEEAKQKP